MRYLLKFCAMIKLGIVEDKPELIRSVMEKVGLFDKVDVVWVAENGEQAIEEVRKCSPDVVLMDINMPVMNGIEATAFISEHYPSVKVVMLTVFDESDKIFDSILAGASGYLLKDEKPARLLLAIEEALEGGAPMSPAIASKALRLIRSELNDRQSGKKVDFGLSAREMEILEGIGRGESYQTISEKLDISPGTVRKHIENIYRKLQVHNKVEAVQLALRHGMI